MRSKSLARVGLFVCFALLPTRVTADDAPRIDVAAGYAFINGLRFDSNFPAGWLAATTWYPVQWLGIGGEVGGSYKSFQLPVGLPAMDASIYNFMGGAKVVRRGSAAMPFAQALFGAIRVGNNYGGYRRDPAWQFGGGVDLKIVGAFGIRAQADYRLITPGGQCCVKEFRVATGVAFMK